MFSGYLTLKITILWIYIVMLIAGGLMGYIKAKSKASIIASTISATLLILVGLKVLPSTLASILLAVLLILFGTKYIRSGNLMPSGIMCIITLITFLVWLILGDNPPVNSPVP
jgi:uncharacterized membrane protein (UPF0136 family)